MQTNQPSRSSGLRDNHRHGKVSAFFEEKTKANSHIAIVTAYFTVAAYMRMKPVLARGEKIRLLFGDPAFIAGFEAVAQNAVFSINDEALALLSKLDQRASVADCIEWFTNDVEVRSVIEPGFLHGKMAHISTPDAAHAIVGSSNFTVRGLGLAQDSNNVELNLIAHDSRDCDALLGWFDELWNDKTKVQDVREQVVAYLKQYFKNQTPEFIYQKTLFHVFGEQVQLHTHDDDALSRVGFKQTQIWQQLFEFQRDGVKGILDRLKQYHGCILADSVGLGKTYSALAVIKYYEMMNEKVLVLCPKKLEENWRSYLFNVKDSPLTEDKLSYTVQFHTDLGRAALEYINWGAFDLIVIDESHNFRNNRINDNAEAPDVNINPTRYQFLMQQVVQAGKRSKLLLLSATPVNNSLIDLRNQISLIAGADVSKDHATDLAYSKRIGLASLDNTVKRAQSAFKQWAESKTSERKKADLMTKLGGDFTLMLDKLSLARSREQIKRNFPHELATIGGFPTRAPVQSHKTTRIDLEEDFPSYDEVVNILGQTYKSDKKSKQTNVNQADFLDNIQKIVDKKQGINLAMFMPSFYLLRDGLTQSEQDHYKVLRHNGLTQETRENTLVAIMKVLLLKRLESSVHSFASTLGRTIANIDDLLAKARLYQSLTHQSHQPDLTLAVNDDESADTSQADALEVGKKLKYKLAHLRLDDWCKALNEDRAALLSLYAKAKLVTPKRDAKLADLLAIIEQKLAHPTQNKDGKANRKIIIFTAFADTAQYLYDNLCATPLISQHAVSLGMVLGSQASQTLNPSRNRYNEVLADFSPVSKRNHHHIAKQLDLLIATDCISEGQNLQDCDTVINYDIHWNPVRIIQRFGRVDRIGSPATAVYMHNFWPTDQLDKYINLKHRVETRMALVDISATGSDNPIESDMAEDLVDGELTMREAQLKRLQTEVFDLDEDPNQITLADLSLNEFRQDLHQFLDAQRKALAEAPLGLFAVVPSDPQIAAAQAGVLFCLRQKNTGQSKNNVADAALNPLHDYYLAYVRNDGTVQLGHAQAKAVLNLWRTLSAGKTEPYETVCRAFDLATQGGKDMSAVSILLQAATAHIKQAVQGTATVQLTLNREFKLPAKLEQNLAENAFELVTWLVIQDA